MSYLASMCVCVCARLSPITFASHFCLFFSGCVYRALLPISTHVLSLDLASLFLLALAPKTTFFPAVGKCHECNWYLHSRALLTMWLLCNQESSLLSCQEGKKSNKDNRFRNSLFSFFLSLTVKVISKLLSYCVAPFSRGAPFSAIVSHACHFAIFLRDSRLIQYGMKYSLPVNLKKQLLILI